MEYGSQTANTADSLAGDLKNAAADAGDALKNTGQQLGDQLGERYQGARAKFQKTMGTAKTNLSAMEEKVGARTRDAVDTTDQFVKEHPWQSVGIGAVAGLVIGFLMMRR
ncbi:DUF883 family protein [Janthinobacterium sp. 17J80-10]|uniref:DUF883 family protein n=1 Tax=Janthinobacterium sp. 17J80-10 TaxID=2497863 RepID=UPI0010053888|nr:DUF883 family protein [Janthinobacterium sp. 17J80-10]QAU35685.1 DUF883 domain-containing protein [Janthinobacterium sp. 17J80-10]